MYCPSLDSVFLRSNGSLTCWDDFGSRLVLKKFEPAKDYARDVYWGTPYNSIRQAIHHGHFPHPDFCQKCFCIQYDRQTAYNPTPDIYQLNVEASMNCGLRCPACTSLFERTEIHPAPHNLPMEIYTKVLSDFKKANIAIHNIIFSGSGEPLMNRNLGAMISFTKALFRDSVISVCTNANARLDPALVDSGISNMVFAIDGVDRDTYNAYRVGGDFQMAYDFMNSFCAEKNRKRLSIRTIWRYVLFSHNDSKEQIHRALELARDACVDELLFIFTCSGPASQRIVSATQLSPYCKDFSLGEQHALYLDLPSENIFFLRQRMISRLFIYRKKHPSISGFVIGFLKRIHTLTLKKWRRCGPASGNNSKGKLSVSAFYFKPDLHNAIQGLLKASRLQSSECPQYYLNQIVHSTSKGIWPETSPLLRRYKKLTLRLIPDGNRKKT
jgi:wyosine [tRNA(Phe)-imidazoG37] synthetase (radical SAM superfamily)